MSMRGISGHGAGTMTRYLIDLVVDLDIYRSGRGISGHGAGSGDIEFVFGAVGCGYMIS